MIGPIPTNDPRVPTEFPITSNGIAFIAEAPGQDEIAEGRPLIGASGQEFNSMLHQAGILRSESFIGNVFDFYLPDNQVSSICGTSAEMPKDYTLQAVEPAKYVRPEYLYSLDRLRAELEIFKPRVIVPMGNTALWALKLERPAITKARGYTDLARLVPCKIVPTFHPAHVLRNYELRTTVIADFLKAKRNAEFPEIRRPLREVWICPTIEDLYRFEQLYLQDCKLLSIDIETIPRRRIIRCIGLSPRKDISIVVPFWDPDAVGGSYWQSFNEEREAYRWCKRIIEGPILKRLQNGLYDLLWLWRIFRIAVMNFARDTQVSHHALQPELPKSLHFMGSIYTEETAWKLERPRGRKFEDKDE